RRRDAAAARDRDRRRPDRKPGADALHDPGRLSLPRPFPAVGIPGPRAPASPGDGRGRSRGMTTTMTSLRNIAALAALAAVASGCMVGPDYVRATAPEAPTSKEAAGWKQGEPKDLAPRGAWWTPFGDADLDALVEQVAPENLTVQVAAARVREAQAGVRIARAPLWPAVGATGTAVRRSQAGAPGVPSVSNNYNVAADLSWELDLWGGIRRGVEASQSTAQATEADLAGAVLSLQALLAQDYLLLRVQDAEIKLLQSTVAAYETSLTLTRNQYAAGIVARGDVAQAETQLASTKAQLIDAGVTRAQLEHAIAVLIGKPPALLAIAPREFVPVFPQIPVALPSELLERRPDIAAAERRTASANAQVGVAQAAFFPSLNLSAIYGVQS